MSSIADRPVRSGLPVPYVANWTDEHWNRISNDKVQGFSIEGSFVICYADEQDRDRDEHGALWIRNGLGNGGDPEFGQINAPRYRLCIDRCLCQVCSEPIPRDAATWIVSDNEWDSPWYEGKSDGLLLTTNPPVCRSCMPFALSMCPHLRKGAKTLLVTKWHKFGVLGEYYAEPNVAPQLTLVPYENRDAIARTIAKQQLIALDEYEVIEL